MDITQFGWTLIASIIGTVIGIVIYMIFDKAYPGTFN
jgi:hypothetical protein